MSLAARLVVLNVASATLGISAGLALANARHGWWGPLALFGCLLALTAIPRRW